MGPTLFFNAGFMLPNHTDCKGASNLGFNPEKNLTICKTLKMLGTLPNLRILKIELVLFI